MANDEHNPHGRCVVKGVDGMAERLLRAQVPVDETWKLEDLFPTASDWENELDAVVADIPLVTAYRGRLAEGASVFLECLESVERIVVRMYEAGSYAFLKFSADGSDPVNQEMMGRSASAEAKLRAAIAFMEPEILALPDGLVEKYLADEPKLASFRRTLEKILVRKPYVLSRDTETALAALTEALNAPDTIYHLAKSGDMVFKPVKDCEGREVPVSFATYEEALEISPDTVLRRNAYYSFSEGLKRFQNTFGGTLGAEIKKHVAMAEIRGHKSATHMFLLDQEVSEEFYLNLVRTVQSGLAPHMRRYVELRKKVLGLDKVLYCDIEAPLDPDFKSNITYEEGAKLILDSVQAMGPEYAGVVKDAIEGRWIDRADNVGKATGAFCAPIHNVHPYILATWGGNMRSVFTIAHELGHTVHATLASRYQRPSNSEISGVFVEAPSTFGEMLLARHILANESDSRMRRWVLTQMLATYYHNFVRHILEAELVRRVYVLADKGNPITGALLSKLKGDILNEYWDGVVEVDDGARLTWMRQGHYYMGLYSYTYSAGLVTSTLVADDLAQNGDVVARRWVDILKAGDTRKPLELARMAGVDLEDAATVQRAVDYVGRVVDELVASF